MLIESQIAHKKYQIGALITVMVYNKYKIAIVILKSREILVSFFVIFPKSAVHLSSSVMYGWLGPVNLLRTYNSGRLLTT